MCDFSKYGGKSEEWLRLEKTLPPPPQGLSQEELQRTVNQTREEGSRVEMSTFSNKVRLQDHTIPARDGYRLEARSYRPSNVDERAVLPIVLYFHGGGFFFGTLSSDDSFCARIAIDTGAIVLNLNYRHTPRWAFPTPLNDSEDAFDWLQSHASEFGGDPSKVVVTGNSAGGLLTCSLVQKLHRDLHPARSSIKGIVPMVPNVVQTAAYGPYLAQMKDDSVSSYLECEFAPILNLERLLLYTGLMIPDGSAAVSDRRASPGLAPPEELEGLPSATIVVCGLDITRDQGLLYAKRLHENGVPTRVHVFKGMPHDFVRYRDKLPSSEMWWNVVNNGVRWALSEPTTSLDLYIYEHSTSILSSGREES